MRWSFTKYACGLVAAAALVGATATPASAQAVFTNGSGLGLGILESGAMGVGSPLPAEAGAAAGLPANSGLVGLSFVADYGGGTPDWRDATTPGCLCEGFGVSVNGTDSGYDGNSGGPVNLTILDPGGTAVGTDSFTTLVELASMPGLTIAHDYHPSTSTSLYEATVTITNSTAADVTNVRYRRVMDWDVPPTEFSEYVTLQGAGLGDLIDSCDDGFETADPLVDCSGLLFEDVNAVDSGPADHGASFTFDFGGLLAGASKSFKIYYGAAGTEAAALAALVAVGAEGIYSLAQSSTAGGPTIGTPATFIFGFGGVGAPPLVPEPGTLLLLGGGLVSALVRRYRRA